jgi:C_GCAxxG_C_C family probable redox protein
MKDEKESETIALDRGMHYEAVYHGCGQCTFAAIQDALGRHDDEVFKSACALEEGIARYGDGTCGAYLASVMMFGVLFGRSRDNFSGGKEEINRVRRLTGLMREYFLAKYSSIDCKDVQTAILGRSYYIWDEEEKKKFEEAGAHTTKCTSLVGEAAAYAVRIILDEQKRLETTKF